MSKTLLIGEIGLSHDGSLGVAMSMIDACKEANLDFVKFQYHNAKYESTVNEVFRVKTYPQDQSRYDYWQRTSFSTEEWKQLVEHAKQKDIKFLCTPFSTWAANELLKFGLEDVKIASGDADNWELLDFAKKNFSQIFLSIGMSTRDEVSKIRNFMKGYEGKFVIMQCTSSYPVELKRVGFNYISELKESFPHVGLSDHSGNVCVALASVVLNLAALEFHVVYSKKQFGPDSDSSLTFEEANKVSVLRDSMTKLLDENYDKDDITNSLSEIRIIFGRGLALKQDMKVGDELLSENLTLKKPKGPLTWSDRELIIGKRAKHNLKSSVHLNLSDFN